ncbi:flagellar basal body L-ring protein FlgH [Hyphomonas sp.]|uniref:flagellar basal body L-ring protein FlgH n=1 Tax=Hyphomonas sp. TaxID=87 RepID=UPI00391ABC17
MKQLLPIPVLAMAAACATAQSPVVAQPAPLVAQGPFQGFGAPAFDTAPRAESASLWETAPTALLSMRRAKEVGDLLTVVVEMNDRASMQNSLSRSRSANEDMSLDAFFGLTDWANGVLPGRSGLSPAIDYGRSSSLNGSGAVNRAEKIAFTLAARVVAVEPNGNLVIQGYQQTRVSNEVRYLTVSGVVRAQDITRTNTVSYEKIAEADLSYVSTGDASSAAQRKPLARRVDRILPF